jgi:hypothetical protein
MRYTLKGSLPGREIWETIFLVTGTRRDFLGLTCGLIRVGSGASAVACRGSAQAGPVERNEREVHDHRGAGDEPVPRPRYQKDRIGTSAL